MPIPTGVYEIRSLAETRPIIGVMPPLPPSAGLGPVILSKAVRTDGTGLWNIVQQGDTEIYQLSISGFEYTGVSDKEVIIATNTAKDNKLWYIKEVFPREYIIAQADERALGWTVDRLAIPSQNVVLLRLPPPDIEKEALPNPFYHLFDIIGPQLPG